MNFERSWRDLDVRYRRDRRDHDSDRGRYTSSRRHNSESSHPRNEFSSHHYRHHRETESSCSRVKSRDQAVDLRDSSVYANYRQRRQYSYCSWSGERGPTDGTRLEHDGSSGVKRDTTHESSVRRSEEARPPPLLPESVAKQTCSMCSKAIKDFEDVCNGCIRSPAFDKEIKARALRNIYEKDVQKEQHRQPQSNFVREGPREPSYKLVKHESGSKSNREEDEEELKILEVKSPPPNIIRDINPTDVVNKINVRLLNMAGYGSSAAGESIPVHDLTDSEADDDDVVVIE